MSRNSIEFVAKVRDWEKKQFSEFEKENRCLFPNRRYWYFAPSYHFHEDLLLEYELEEIKEQDKKLLFVGSNYGYFERYLFRKVGIPMKNIVISDIDDQHLPDKTFKGYSFDMYKDWPEMEEGPFDYILFPKSILLPHSCLIKEYGLEDKMFEKTVKGKILPYYKAFSNAYGLLKEDGIIRSSGTVISPLENQVVRDMMAQYGKGIIFDRSGSAKKAPCVKDAWDQSYFDNNNVEYNQFALNRLYDYTRSKISEIEKQRPNLPGIRPVKSPEHNLD